MPGSWAPHELPNLTANNHLITSPATPRYNCIGWAAGDDTLWWWPVGRYYWPPNIPREETMDAFIRAYATLGYIQCSDGSLEAGFERIAIFATPKMGGGQTPTHAARQLPNGKWSSKLGNYEDIEHQSPDCVDCPTYGNAAVYLKRPTDGS